LPFCYRFYIVLSSIALCRMPIIATIDIINPSMIKPHSPTVGIVGGEGTMTGETSVSSTGVPDVQPSAVTVAAFTNDINTLVTVQVYVHVSPIASTPPLSV